VVAIGHYRIAGVDRRREWWLQFGFCGAIGVLVLQGWLVDFGAYLAADLS
jgi:hypothetical protein